ncbi:putative mitochondrial import inner membrane translocase subunit Tim17 [Babesia bovis T2Bo]|uniref:Mitochondrial inner membrane translocase subunit TIM44, putative n=1 Tax=Babesia bovis TaxID=5865 RepID=A7ARK8_BABBO|nr:putative mitochondrial import inner membrane translocase subunit Tim17 [Babesia bovis T2Bo]EDO07177.1 putative mitochondrial import inner membrane translocase subunit Tim17 [Babesia bovis T2Bo]|eukprot:XP_001610745.1 mitochondrial inner membrane translocase subunit TIM44 [Babesia bovis T2Bo]
MFQMALAFRRKVSLDIFSTSGYRTSLTRNDLTRTLHRNSQPGRVFNGFRLFSSDSFVQSVINQVKRDLEKDEKFKEAMKSLEEAQIKEKVNRLGEIYTRSKDACSHYVNKITETSSNSSAVKFVFTSAKSLASGMTRVAELLHDEKSESKALKAKWKQRVASQRAQSNINVDGSDVTAVDTNVPDSNPQGNTQEYALVLAKESVWERFGTRLRDMPFLTNFFENPVFDQLFGNSTLAKAVKEMKRLDSSFDLPEFIESVEHVVAPHIVQCYLDGDSKSLEAHCGELAFNVLNASIRERDLQKLYLDPNILILKDVELKGGMTMEEGYPWFIFNFKTQQINCLRDSRGHVVAGEIDDIRQVVYSMAVSRHPDISRDGLEYPYMVHEVAIIGNTQCW